MRGFREFWEMSALALKADIRRKKYKNKKVSTRVAMPFQISVISQKLLRRFVGQNSSQFRSIWDFWKGCRVVQNVVRSPAIVFKFAGCQGSWEMWYQEYSIQMILGRNWIIKKKYAKTLLNNYSEKLLWKSKISIAGSVYLVFVIGNEVRSNWETLSHTFWVRSKKSCFHFSAE